MLLKSNFKWSQKKGRFAPLQLKSLMSRGQGLLITQRDSHWTEHRLIYKHLQKEPGLKDIQVCWLILIETISKAPIRQEKMKNSIFPPVRKTPSCFNAKTYKKATTLISCCQMTLFQDKSAFSESWKEAWIKSTITPRQNSWKCKSLALL